MPEPKEVADKIIEEAIKAVADSDLDDEGRLDVLEDVIEALNSSAEDLMKKIDPNYDPNANPDDDDDDDDADGDGADEDEDPENYEGPTDSEYQAGE